jgi:aminoglycoside/choline kinase family phosphotransferase
MKRNPDYQVIEKISTGGSAREFYRIRIEGKNYMLIRGPAPYEYRRLQRCLLQRHIGVPELYSFRGDETIIEDLGDDTLLRIALSDPMMILDRYRKVIRALIGLQFCEDPGKFLDRHYDHEHIRWEQDYFRAFFLGQYSGLRMSDLRALDREFLILSRDVVFWNEPFDGFFMHRDFQSQNIIFKNGRPRFIDFQSARIGPLTYDLASLLKDSYLTIDERLEDSMIRFYLGELKTEGLIMDPNLFMKAYRLAGLQRNMQALGAFANLSLNKGKPSFRSYIPRAATLLRAGLRNSPYLQLKRIMDKLPHG